MLFQRRKHPGILFAVAMVLSIACSILPVRAEGNGASDGNTAIQDDTAVAPDTTIQNTERAQSVDGEIVIVIDPGHGGKNLGTEAGHTIEKEMTLVTAKAMFQELDKYDNVKVYLTRSDDEDISLAKRAQFAKDVGADFLFSIHYNASENHTMFGSEVWISCETPYNAYGYQFGYLHLQSMAEKGLFIRGVKNRMDPKNKNDYYGVIRESAARDVPAVIIEHCYVDAPREAQYIEDEEGWKEFGRADALSVAKYFGLKSTALGVDYSQEPAKLPQVDANSVVAKSLEDLTPPEVCMAELVSCNYETGAVSLTISAADYDSPLIYYNYSLDNGETWSELESWADCDTLTGKYTDTFVLNLRIPDGVKPDILVRAYNISDIYADSNTVTFDQAFVYDPVAVEQESLAALQASEEATAVTQPPEHTKKSVGTTTFMPADSDSMTRSSDERLMGFLKISLIIVILLFFVVLVSQAIHYRKRKRRRRRDH